MSNRRNLRVARKTILGKLDMIYRTSERVAREFDARSLPFNAFRKIVSKAKFDIDQKDVPVYLNDFFHNYNNTIEEIYLTGVRAPNENGYKTVPLIYIKQMVDNTKNVFTGHFKTIRKNEKKGNPQEQPKAEG